MVPETSSTLGVGFIWRGGMCGLEWQFLSFLPAILDSFSSFAFFSFEFPAVDPVEIGKKKHAWVKPLQSKASRNRIPSTGKSEFLKSS